MHRRHLARLSLERRLLLQRRRILSRVFCDNNLIINGQANFDLFVHCIFYGFRPLQMARFVCVFVRKSGPFLEDFGGFSDLFVYNVFRSRTCVSVEKPTNK